MRKVKIWAVFLLIFIIMVSGCSKRIYEEAQKHENSSEMSKSSGEEAQKHEDSSEIPEAYGALLEEYHQFILHFDHNKESNDDFDDSKSAIWEMLLIMKPQEILKEVGYTLMDMNKDNVPELVIGDLNSEAQSMEMGGIYALFTLKEDAPHLILTGNLRDKYFYLGEGEFVNQSANRWDYYLSLYKLNKGETTLEPKGLYASQIQESSDAQEKYYYSESNNYDFEHAQELKQEEFDKALETIKGRVVKVEYTPFSDYKGESAFEFDSIPVQVEYSTQEEIEYAFDYDGFNTEDKDAVMVTFTTNDMTKDFKILHLKNVEVDENGKMTYEAEEAYHQEVLDPNRPFIAGLYFYGSIPNNGISYVNEDGDTVTLVLHQSGEDGSLYLQQLNE